jgi:amino acid adenylation domain-containing protein
MSELRERLSRLPLEQRMRFLSLLRDGTDQATSGLVPRERGTTAPLSHAQNLLWFLDRLSPGQPTYNVVLSFWLRGALDVAALEAAAGAVVARHEVLRTALAERPDGPVQIIESTVDVELAVTEVVGADIEEQRANARKLTDELFQEPFDLGRAPLWRLALFRTGPEEHLFTFVVHHAVFDGVSAAAFTAELAEHYGALVEHRAPRPPELPVQYADFALWQREQLSGTRRERLLAYWREQLRDLPVLDIPADYPRPPEFTFRGAVLRGPLPEKSVLAAHELARELGVTPYVVYSAVLMTLLHRYTDQDDLAFGCSTSVRGRAEVQNLIGFFVNMLALRVDVGGAPTFRELVRRVDGVVRAGFAHVELPFEQVVQEVSPVRDLSRSPLVQCAFLLPEQPRSVEMYGLRVDVEEPEVTTAKFDMTWQVFEAGPDSAIDVEYCVDLFTPETVTNMQRYFAQLLSAALAEPDRPVGTLELLTPAERDEQLELGTGPHRQWPETTLDAWFAETVRRDPGATAVVAGDLRLSYAELDERSNRLAHLLRAHGAGPERLVALCLPRGVDYPVAVLAVLKAGAAFVPLDPEHPWDRVDALLRDCAPVAVLTATTPEWAQDAAVAVLALDALAERLRALPDEPPAPTARPADLAYVLYTSGSTGTPKGVLIEHRAVGNFIHATQELFAMTSADHVLGYASYTFDVSVFEMFGALLTGAQLHVALDTNRLDLDRLQELLERAGISVMDMPPSVMALLDPARLTTLRVAFVGGEAFSGELVNRWNQVSNFYNGYGPTECTVTMIVHECHGRWDGSPPIGLPIANHVAHVLDGDLRPVPYGVPGELVIGGLGLARGYLNRPELTEEVFVPDPFGTAPGGRLYRTGDLVKRRADGAIVFLGRIDRQVKIRGVRIEPGEVEAVLATCPGVRQAYVTPWRDARGRQRLLAYAGVPDGQASSTDLRARLAEKLPAAMVPDHVFTLPELPLTSSGKWDVRTLPTPDSPGHLAAPEGVAPRTETERVLAEELFGPMLDRPTVDVTARFFELGGSSLQAAQLIARIRVRFEVEVSVTDFFRDSTVAGLAVLVERQRAARLDHDELLDLLDKLSGEEVGRIMGGADEVTGS